MHPRQPVPVELERLALHQAGVVSREQALGLGATRHTISRLVDSGRWTRLTPGVFLVPGGRPDWTGWAWTAVLRGGTGARLTDRAAAHCRGLIDEPPAQLTVLIPGHRGPLQPHVGEVSWRFRRELIGLRDCRTVGSPPTVTVEDAVIDLVESAEAGAVAGWITKAVQRRLTTPGRLRAAAARRPRLKHLRLLEDLLADVAVGAQSPLELRYLRDVERAHGLPRGIRQAGRRGTFTDVRYAEYGLLVELDGRLGHTGEGRFRDMRRDNLATVDGLASLRYGWTDVSTVGCGVARQVGHTLQLRGWPGPVSTCPRCRRVPIGIPA